MSGPSSGLSSQNWELPGKPKIKKGDADKARARRLDRAKETAQMLARASNLYIHDTSLAEMEFTKMTFVRNALESIVEGHNADDRAMRLGKNLAHQEKQREPGYVSRRDIFNQNMIGNTAPIPGKGEMIWNAYSQKKKDLDRGKWTDSDDERETAKQYSQQKAEAFKKHLQDQGMATVGSKEDMIEHAQWSRFNTKYEEEWYLEHDTSSSESSELSAAHPFPAQQARTGQSPQPLSGVQSPRPGRSPPVAAGSQNVTQRPLPDRTRSPGQSPLRTQTSASSLSGPMGQTKGKEPARGTTPYRPTYPASTVQQATQEAEKMAKEAAKQQALSGLFYRRSQNMQEASQRLMEANGLNLDITQLPRPPIIQMVDPNMNTPGLQEFIAREDHTWMGYLRSLKAKMDELTGRRRA
ncbi:MAG: hypothetical protein M1820_008301 [Bogoriella megaspora]|nr:MAG: hypothetical protein M1820_008301 [Bogoriella megaspora]